MCAQFDLNGEVAEIIGVPGEDKLAARPPGSGECWDILQM